MSSKLLGDAFDADIKPIAYKVVLLKLVDAARDDGTKIWPSVKTIAKAAGVSERHTKRVLHGFVSVGLLRVTQIGGKGRGDTTEYSLDLATLRRLGTSHSVTFVNGTGTFEKKGDMVSEPEKRVTPEAVKGDTSHPQPLKDPLEEREGARAQGQKQALNLNLKPIMDGKPEEALAAIERHWPPGAVGNRAKALGLLADMTPEQRKREVDAAPRYLRALKDEKRKYVPAIETYLANGDSERFPEPRGSTAAEPEIELKPYVAELWAMLWRAVKASKPEAVAYALSRMDKGLTTVQRAVPPADEVSALVAVKIGSPEHEAWSVWCQRMGIRLPAPSMLPVVFVPSPAPDQVKMVGYRPYQLLRPQRLEYRSKIWWWRLHQRIADGKPLVTYVGKQRVDPVEEVRRKVGTDEVHFGPWPADSDLVGMVHISTLTDEFEQWNTYFALLGSSLDLWPDNHIWAPGHHPPAVYTPASTDPVPDYDALEAMGEMR